MQPLNSVTTTLLTFIITALFLLKLLTRYRTNRKLPPGPWNLPLLGSIHHLVKSSSSSLLHVALQTLSQTYGPFMHLKIGEFRYVIASSPEAAKAIMKTHDITFATRPISAGVKIFSYGGKGIAFTPYNEYWRQLRKICILELLSAKRVGSFRSIRQEEVRNLIRSIGVSDDDTIINVSEKVKLFTNHVTVRASIGSGSKWVKCDQMAFLDALNAAVDIASGFNVDDIFPSISWLVGLVSGYKAKVEACFQNFDRIVHGILQEHKQKKKQKSNEEDEFEDLIDILLKIQMDDSLQFELSDDCIKAVVMDIISAGSETSSTVILWAMSELMRNPAAMKKVQKEIREIFKEDGGIVETRIGEANYLQSVIKETLRLHAPIPLLLPRECRETCKVLGYEIPEGTRAIVNVWAIGRDPEFWVDAERFIPERFEGSEVNFKGNSFEFLPFGSGRRMCPGLLFGVVSVEVALANLLYYFNWQLPQGVRHDELDMTELFGVTIRRKLDLCLGAKVAIPLPQ